MRVGRICSHDVMSVEPGDHVSRAATLMRENHVGSVAVIREGKPVGIVTDRDIVVRGGGRREALADIRVREVMTRDPITIGEQDDACFALERMREFGVRRLLVINEGGFLAGVLSLDDVTRHVSRTLRLIAEVIAAEYARESKADEAEARV